MANFMIRFLLCNVLISGIVGILLIAKWVFRNNLSNRMQYNLWLLLLGLLAVPFIPFCVVSSCTVYLLPYLHRFDSGWNQQPV